MNLNETFRNRYSKGFAPFAIVDQLGSWKYITDQLSDANNMDAVTLLTEGLQHVGMRNVNRSATLSIVYGGDTAGSEPVRNIIDIHNTGVSMGDIRESVNNLRREKINERRRKNRLSDKTPGRWVSLDSRKKKEIANIYKQELARSTYNPLSETRRRVSKMGLDIPKSSLKYLLVCEKVYDGGPRNTPKCMTPEEVEKAEKMLGSGMSLIECAEKLSRARSTITRNIAKKRGNKTPFIFDKHTPPKFEKIERAYKMRKSNEDWDSIQQKLFSDEDQSMSTVKLLVNRLEKARERNLNIKVSGDFLSKMHDGNPAMIVLPHPTFTAENYILMHEKAAKYMLPIIAAYEVVGRRLWSVKGFDIPLDDSERYLIAVLNAKKLSKPIKVSSVKWNNNPELVPHIATGEQRDEITKITKEPLMTTQEAKHMATAIEAELLSHSAVIRRLSTRFFTAKAFA